MMFAGSVSEGAVVSITRTVNDALAVLFAASLATQETLVIPSGNTAPDAKEQVTGTVPSTLSVAVAL